MSVWVTRVILLYNMGFDTRKPSYVAREEQSGVLASTSMQSDHCLCYSLSEKYNSPASSMQNFNNLASLCS